MVYERNSPPKNMISVTRNTHMPSVAASRCCSAESKWWACAAMALDGTMGLPRPGVLVGAVGHDRRLLEVLGGGRRGGSTLQAAHAPRVRRGVGTGAHRRDGGDEASELAGTQAGGARR